MTFDDLLTATRPSVYVISDSELKAYKKRQLEREILSLKQLVDGHKQSIEQLEVTIAALEKSSEEE